ncbi:outer membrane protein OmpA-like peptidoglycan-associated protein/tetratricopeptide (TPR) repeat protein [Pontibacter aydingkolensis]|uniref:OmpA family protein n=1 Tax=Pontibacter aydingkolensis TaxID=1911536 RepID=A0ABS7CSW7_9BACT|nr:OmpA family protein [Pontibacter aydingkolensis]MBW7466944.1 OmpA family protein [Pontibacter aydingkolensis]
MNYKSTPLYFVIAAMMGLGTAAQAQTELKKANKQYENYEFALALENYQVAVQKKDPDLATMQRIADAYRLTRQNQKAEEWYAKVVRLEGHDPMSSYFYAEALRSNGKYEEAKAQYMLWADEMPEKEDKAQELIAACDRAILWLGKPAAAVVEPVASINTNGFSDFSPMQYGNQIIFTSDRGLSDSKKTDVYGWTGRPYLQLFTAQQNEAGNWGAPKALEEVINSEYHNATASAAEDGKTLYFTRTHMVPKKNHVNADPTSWAKAPAAKEFVNRLEIFTAEKQGETWSNIQPFAYNNVESHSVGHPAISPDGKVLYFASDMEGTLGDTDIFYSIKQADGTWGKPVNAGPTINTAARESFPYVDADGKLYFASDGHIGFGGLDVFEAEGTHAAWTKVRNVGAPINSAKNDYGIMFTRVGEEGLFSSNRDSENGTEDIFSFKMLQRPVVIELITLERKQNDEKRNIEVPLPKAKIVVAQKNLNDSVVVITDERGQYFMDGRRGDIYSLLGTKDGYLTQEKLAEIPANAGDTVQIAMLFDKNELNRAIVLENIYYDLDKWDIRTDAATELDKLATVLKNNPEVKIEMSSHTDSRESVKYNNVLSERRAKAAVDYLVSQGIDRSRLTAKGYGKSRLVNGCADGVECSEEEHQLNRRTEFRIIK